MNNKSKAWEDFLRRTLEENLWEAETLNINKTLLEELQTIKNDQEALHEHFYKYIEFGTAGLRGIIGVGTNRMNIYTVAKATEGIGKYILAGEYAKDTPSTIETYKQIKARPAVAIAYDSRNHSKIFAEITGKVLSTMGIDVYIYKELMPVPALSFATRRLGCAMGVMITASHNPAEYNGYKVYDNTGCQITPDAAQKIYGFIENVDAFKTVESCYINQEDSEKGQLIYIDDEIVEEYLDAVQKESTKIEEKKIKELQVVFSPLNGAGNGCVRRILKRIGVENVHIVKEQEMPDGNFPTCKFPNPEKREAMALGLDLCRSLAEKAVKEGNPENIPDLLIATDPDCDRIGTAIRRTYQGDGEYVMLTGNDIGVLLLDFLIEKKVKTGQKTNPKVYTSIVSTKLIDAICKKHGVALTRTLTGFKFIGEQIALLENEGQQEDYLLGFEESYGYLSGTYVRDKDGVNAAMLICEMTAHYKGLGLTLAERLDEIYKEYGYYKDALSEFIFEGSKGMDKMAEIMSNLRRDVFEKLAGKLVVEYADYKTQERTLFTGTGCCGMSEFVRGTGLPKAEVIEYVLEDGSGVQIRPSGTEPKLKIYISAKGESEEFAYKSIEEIRSEIASIVEAV